MNQDNLEGASRTASGQGDHMSGDMPKDESTTPHRPYDEFLGQSPSALAGAKDVATSGVDAASSIDLSGVRDEIAKLTQSVTDLVQKQALTTRDQLMGVVGAAGDNLSRSTSVAQDTLTSMEGDMATRIRKNPWSAMAIAALIGLLIGKMT
jgi:ElaB/YqjD/DUF883 family membrane-anchored ribosome-binding protein